MEEEVEQVSDFYLACRNNDIDLVSLLLDERSLEELDCMEPNNSTALHVACFLNRPKIVRLLLERGFTRCERNKYKLLPIQEAKHESTRQLFLRSAQSTRFGGRTSLNKEKSNWIILDGNNQQLPQDPITDICFKGNSLMVGVFRDDDIRRKLSNMSKFDVIQRYLRRAVADKDWRYFLQAYTADTDFPEYVNKYLLTRREDGGFKQFVQTIYLNEKLHEQHWYVGYCYRCICVDSEAQLSVYQKGSKLMNRTFISAMQDREIAEERAREQRLPGDYLVTLIFKIRERRKALDIERFSEFPFEEEVLIMFDNVFEIKDVIKKDPFDWNIKIYESK